MFRRLLHQTEDQSVTPLGFIEASVENDRGRITDQRSRFRFTLGYTPDRRPSI